MIDFEDTLVEELGFIEIVTPGQIETYRNDLLSTARSLNNDFQRASVDPYIKESWDIWYSDLLEYAADSSWLGDLWGSALTVIETKAKQLEDWRDIYKDETGNTATGVSVLPSSPAGVVEWTTLVKWVAIPVLAYFIWDITKSFRR